MIWTLPDAQTYITTPGSAVLFPTLLAPTVGPPTPPVCPPSGERSLKMPRRKFSRVRNRARYIAAERARNRQEVEASRPPEKPATPEQPGDDPPPF